MATIRKLPSGNYNCQIRKRGHRPVTQTFKTRVEAERWAELESVFQSKNSKNSKPISLLDLGRSYIRHNLLGRPSEYQTSRRLERVAKNFSCPVHNINKWQVNDYKRLRLTQVGPSTCRDELLLIKRVIEWGIKELLLDCSNPVREIQLPRPSKPRTKVISPEELNLILSEVSEPMKPIIELAYETAMRRSEILKLTPECLHLDHGILDVVEGKTGDRSVPLSRRAIEILREAQAKCLTPTSRLFPYSPYGVSQALRRARETLGLSKDIRFHQLRHTRISLVAKKGFNQAQIMMVSGHRDSRSVQRYTHLNVSDVVKLLD